MFARYPTCGSRTSQGYSCSKSNKIHPNSPSQMETSHLYNQSRRYGGLNMLNTAPPLSIPWNATREQPQGPFWVCQWPLKPDMQNGLNHWLHQERQTGMVVRYSNDLNCSSGDKALRILRQTLVFLNIFPRRPTGSYCKSRASKGQPLHPSLWLWWQWPSNHMTKAACFPSAGGHLKTYGQLLYALSSLWWQSLVNPGTLQVPTSIPTCIT